MTEHECFACHVDTPEPDLLELVDTRSGHTLWVHRPSVRGGCFANRTLPASVHRIVPRKSDGGDRDGAADGPRDGPR